MKTKIKNIIGVALLCLPIMVTQTSAAMRLNPGFSFEGTLKVAPSPPLFAETLPHAPSLVIFKKTTASLGLGWQDKSAVEEGFRIYRKEAEGDWAFLKETGPQTGTDKLDFYADEALADDTQYCYRAEVYNIHGSNFSETNCAYTNSFLPDGSVFVEDRVGLVSELEAQWTGKKAIYVADNAEIDLTSEFALPLKDGLTLMSGRDKLNSGALLFTKMRDWSDKTALFRVVGDNVRVTGLRIQGPELGIGDGILKRAKGIRIDSKLNIEIDHTELFGWSGVAIFVQDREERINGANSDAVYIHDNFIHHNQYEDSHGYGVDLAYGAYALIERNVFDFNRHAIAADGREGTGYLAYKNLVLKNGGVHCGAGLCVHTHQFDMHGRSSCGISGLFSDTVYNCGLAGEYMDIRYNTFQYTKANAFKLRGTPELWDTPGISPGAYVTSNVFAHELFSTGSGQLITTAVAQTETGLDIPYTLKNNLFGINTSTEIGEGDFDGDGVIDTFQATGATWWYSSGGQTEWRYLNASDMRLKDLTMRDVDGNGKTDVLTPNGDDWLVSYDGTGPWTKISCLVCKSQQPNFPNVLATPDSGGSSKELKPQHSEGAKLSSSASSLSILSGGITFQIKSGR